MLSHDLSTVTSIALSRLDICYNHRIGKLLPHYISALSRLDHARRVVARFNTETVEFRAKLVEAKLHDKHAETKGASPFGLYQAHH